MGDIPLLLLAVPLTALSVAGLSNAYNMIDGIDGLAAGTLALPLVVLYLLAAQSGHPMAESLLLAAAGVRWIGNWWVGVDESVRERPPSS